MEIHPEMLERLLAQSDEDLWETVKKIAAMNNISLPLPPPSHSDMEKLRTGLKSGAIGYEDAMRILSSYPKGEKS